jgi:chorismate dehydratase
MLNIGKISYLNVYPLYNSISSGRLIEGEPSDLNKLLRNGQIDISPSSSFEYIKNPENYFILKDFSISSKKRVLSVVLILKNRIEELEKQVIYLSPASATTNILVQVILKEFYNYTNIDFQYFNKNIFHKNLNHLLIGDEALKVYFQKRDSCYIYDIGELWYNYTNLPFVFALWLINKKNISSKNLEMKNFIEKLKYNKQNLLIPQKYKNFTEEQIKEYFKFLDYNFEKEHIQSLKLFSELCKKYNFIKNIPEFNFY